jgi:hypothetical protein
MKKRKVSNSTLRNNPPDHKINKESSDGSEGDPQVFKVARLNQQTKKNRRQFIKDSTRKAAGITGLVALGKILSSCEDTSEIEIEGKKKKCTCHVVCTCDEVGIDGESLKSREFDSDFDGNSCTCNSVCTCNTVCLCDMVCSCDSEGAYWYPN